MNDNSPQSNNLDLILNISCKGIFAINTNLLNTTNKLSFSQFIGLIEGCFSGYDNDPTQNLTFRTELRNLFFYMCNNIPSHCDPDFQTLRPVNIVKFIVQTLSKRGGRVQEYLPLFVPLESENSLPIQLADLIVGTLNLKLRNDEKPPHPCGHLYFDDRKLSLKTRRQDRWAKGYYWLREEGG